MVEGKSKMFEKGCFVELRLTREGSKRSCIGERTQEEEQGDGSACGAGYCRRERQSVKRRGDE